jgi:flagellar hook-associated protein 1 FlgK
MHTYDPGNGQTVIHNQTDTQLSVTGGSIAGAMTARDGALGNLQTGLDTLASQLVEQVNNIYSKGYSSSGVNGQPFFSGDSAANIAVNSTLVADPSQFQASSTSGADGDTQIALELANLAGQPISGLGSQTFSQNYAQTVANLGNAIDTATEELNTSQAVSTSLANQRRSESGVSIDEEMTNIMQFQKAYEASAQLVSTLNAMMQTVINMKSS